MQEAQEKEQEILDSLEQLQAMVNEDLDQLQALTLAQRLRGLGRTEMDLETTLMDGAEDTIGLFPDELAPRWRALHDKLGDTQKETAEQSQELQDEIGRFFERTQKEAYGDVSEDMKAKQTVEGIISTQELILKNITMEAADQVANWSKQFEEWASKLEPEEEGDGSGGGEGGGESKQQDLTKQLMACFACGKANSTCACKPVFSKDKMRNLKSVWKKVENFLTIKQNFRRIYWKFVKKYPSPFLIPSSKKSTDIWEMPPMHWHVDKQTTEQSNLKLNQSPR